MRRNVLIVEVIRIHKLQGNIALQLLHIPQKFSNIHFLDVNNYLINTPPHQL